METQVEIYDMLETTENELQQVDDQSTALIKELGLAGQEEMLNNKGERQPYQIMSTQQSFICANLFPVATELSRYSFGPIPYRVLKEAKAAKEFFKFLYVFHESPAFVKDPILVGRNQEYYTWDNSPNRVQGFSLIARWGEALDSWENLYEKAAKRFFQSNLDFMKTIKLEIEKAITLFSEGVMPLNDNYNRQNILQSLPYKS